MGICGGILCARGIRAGRVSVMLVLFTACAAFSAAASKFDSPAWASLAMQLDRLPVFTVANSEGKPLQYEIDGTPTALFYADIEAAKEELARATKQYPDLGCDLIPVGVGSAYKLSCEGKATVLPASADLAAAGAPKDALAIGQALPLFACMEMSQEIDGQPVLPLFMAWSDCASAVSQATQLDSPDEKLEIVGLSLPSVVDRLLSLESETNSFVFVAPSNSARYIEEYLAD